jgi:hypothetical protein
MDRFKYKEIFSAAYPQDLEAIVKLLGDHGIQGFIEAPGSDFNPNLSFSRTPDNVKLMVLITDFAEAEELLIASEIISGMSESDGMRAMLGGLEDQELLDIIADAKRQPYDQVAMAYLLLEERGVSTTATAVEKATDEMTAIERQPARIAIWLKIVCFLFAFVLPSVIVAASIAIVAFTGKDTHGESYWLYAKEDRRQFALFGIGLLFIWLGVSLYHSRMLISIYDVYYWY